ncbi:SET domain-containing protein [Colletotrichum higginsianum IMI 349063]|uniref:SET domain-containing protein n=2 Tax=Colletotrichum higginsianum (strain IMI 349063) TaxID=759273 RepID=A0A1B7YDM9_COLHI|nr:SET domain-containing protein [Colletotrichum higginsianum IMI 349063]OBR10010.1 SET domain-containing protein [Colletotrichum higginsianum IMI 349063]
MAPFLAGTDRRAPTQIGPYNDYAIFRPVRDRVTPDGAQPGPRPHTHGKSGKRFDFVDLTVNSSPLSRPQSHRGPVADRASQAATKVEDTQAHPTFSPDAAHCLSDPSGGSTAVSSNAASVLEPSPPPVSIQPSVSSIDLDDSLDAEMPRPPRPEGFLKAPQQLTPPSSKRPSSYQSPRNGAITKKQTPKKDIPDVRQLAALLKDCSADIGKAHAQLSLYALKSTKSIETRVKTGFDFFSSVKIVPVEEQEGTTMSVRTKQHFRGRKSDQAKTAHYVPVCVKSNKPAVPKYRFHHTEIAKNFLSPNSLLKFVPVIRDLAPEEERKYNTWLGELERMDESCGFKTLGSRDQRVNRTIKKERTATLSLFLDSWLKKLAIDNCNRATLIRHMASSNLDDAITPQQKTSLVNLHSDDFVAATPRALKAARVFTDAFDQVFYHGGPQNMGILLSDVLKLDKSVDEIVETKKTAKVGQDDADKVDSLEHWIETHTVMGCLICYSNSCEHGDYSLENHKRNFSMDCIGMYGRMFSANRVVSSTNPVEHPPAPLPCERQCYRIYGVGGSDAESRPWTEDETFLLRGLFSILDHNKVQVKAECATAEILDRDCCDVHRHLQSLDINLPPITTIDRPRPKNLPWYDRKKKMLLGDWQDHTNSHDTKVRPSNDPCHHEGPCTAENGCPCVLNDVLCERFCRCTEDCCAYKFTGCACHASGKTCLQKQKEGRPCICVQLNRECDPDLCGTCGALERADPANRHDAALFQTGCQNIAIQRGVSKAVVLGKSQLEGCGYGLFTAEDIAQDEFVIEYTGELIVADEGVRREARRGEAFSIEKSTSYVFSLLDYEGIWVDAAIYGNLSRYINHAVENANVQPSILYVNGEFRIRFTATRSIKAGEELFFNYGENFPNLTEKMIKEKAGDGDEGEEENVVSTKRGRGRRQRATNGSEKSATQRLPKAKFAKSVNTGARKEAPKVAVDDYEVLADLDPTPAPNRKRKRAAKSDDEDEEFHPSLESEENAEVRGAEKRVSTSRRRGGIRRVRSMGSIVPSDSEGSTKTTPRDNRGPGHSSGSQTAIGPQLTAKGLEISTKPAKGTSPPKKRRGRPPKIPRPPSPVVAAGIEVEHGEDVIRANPSIVRLPEGEHDTVPSGLNQAPRSARGRKIMATDLSKSIEDAMDVDEDEPEINVTPTKSRGRKKVEAQGPSRFGRTARHPPTESGAVVDSDDEPFTLSSASRRKRTQKQVLGPLENNDSESSYKVQGAGTDSDDDDEPISSLDRSSRKKKLPARFRSSSYEED